MGGHHDVIDDDMLVAVAGRAMAGQDIAGIPELGQASDLLDGLGWGGRALSSRQTF